MTYEIKGDLQVRRTLIADRRADQGLAASVITGAATLTRHSAWWQALSAAAGQDVNLPDPTASPTCPNGWTVVVQATGAADLTVKDAGTGTVKVVPAGSAYEFTLTNNGSAAGTWHVMSLEDAGTVVASRYTSPHNATTDWGSASGGYYTISVTGAVHGRGTNPMIQYYEVVGGNQIQVTPDQSSVASATGNLSFRVPDSPDLRYAGKVIFI